MIGPLAQLKIDPRFRSRRFEVKGERIRLSDASRAGEELARGQKRQQRSENRRRELRLAFHQVILVATEGRAGVMIDVVLDERDPARAANSRERGLEQFVPGQVVGDKIPEMEAFRRGILDVPHVEIKAAAIEKKTAVARRLLIIPVVQIDGPYLGLAKKMVFDLGRPDLGTPVQAFVPGEAAILGFNPDNAIHPL